ncbi:MAG TPA: class I SAM-dependent methyltransferase [Pseudomonadales bacterium]|jgi:SAM-dependent methyltransferase
MSEREPDYLSGNVAAWQSRAAEYVAAAERAWASDRPYWGIWGIPDAGLGLLPADLSGRRCIELGCGTAYVSAWMCRRGGDVVAIDPTPNQLHTARRLQKAHELDFVIEEGFAEAVGYPDESFDFAISEYGAALWADPYRWVPEASRVLKPEGKLVFLTNSPLAVMCAPDLETDGPVGERLLRPYFGMHTTRWMDAPGETEFHLPHGEWISLLTGNDFVIERLVELQAPPGAHTGYAWADAQWANRWPSEEAWIVSKRAPR